MLTHLTITNLATIESLSLPLENGFTVLTGETGAGKSILIEAIRFVLGDKPASHKVRGGAERTVVEAVFDLRDFPDVRQRLEEMEIPCDRELVLRRVLQSNGRSRAVANDCAITQSRLEELGDFLVNIHGQHDNRMLLNRTTHQDFLDAFAGLLPLREEVAATHAQYTDLLRRRRELWEAASERSRRREELAAMVETLKAANLMPGEEEALQAEHRVLANAEHLRQLLAEACQILHEREGPILEQLAEVAQRVEQAAALDERLRPLADQAAPLRYQLEDLYRTLSTHAGLLDNDPNRLESINTRLAELEKIKRPHGNDLTLALRHLEEGERELVEMDAAEESLESLENEIAGLAGQLHSLSDDLSRKRHKAGTDLGRLVMSHLSQLGMEKAVFETSIQPLRNTEQKAPAYSPTGMDSVEFLLSANPGQPVRPLSNIASGGELSRTMLAFKSVLARTDPTRTLIFDEVDAGISGSIAEIVGTKLRSLGETHQVLCVTHLPQIAALGEHHVRVSKETSSGQTYTKAVTLEGREKVEEVARLLSGIAVTPHSIASAEEMVSRSRGAAT